MRKTRTALALCLFAAPMLAFGAPAAQAFSPTCNSGTSTGATFYNSGGGNATINESTAWRFEAQRNNSGSFYVGAFTYDGASGLIAQNNGSLAFKYVGQWSNNYASLANSEKVTNYGGAATFTYNRTCTRV